VAAAKLGRVHQGLVKRDEAAVLKAASEVLQRGSRHGPVPPGGVDHNHSRESDHGSGSRRDTYAAAAGVVRESSQLQLHQPADAAAAAADGSAAPGAPRPLLPPAPQSSGAGGVHLMPIPEDVASRARHASLSTLSLDGATSSITSNHPPNFAVQPSPPQPTPSSVSTVEQRGQPSRPPLAPAIGPQAANDPSGGLSSATYEEISIALSPQGHPPAVGDLAHPNAAWIDTSKSGNVIIRKAQPSLSASSNVGSPPFPSLQNHFRMGIS
jgi:hypothetical protein